jgi:hypothetical protein
LSLVKACEKDSKEYKRLFKLYGIKQECKLNELSFFHQTNNYSMDIMHDFFEGIFPLEISLVLEQFTLVKEKEERYFELIELNRLIQGYNFDLFDHKNKPGAILHNVSGKQGFKLKTKMKAAKMTCLVRYLPFIIGKRVPLNDIHWKLFTILSKILDYVNSTHLNLNNTYALEILVREHHEMFKTLFPDVPLKKKHHNLVHYANSIRQLGNLVDYNSLRFESKHTFATAAADAAQNTINLPKTVTNKHQMYALNNLYKNSNLTEELEIKKKTITSVNRLDIRLQFLLLKSNLFFEENEEIYSNMEIKIFSQFYCNYLYLVVKRKNKISVCFIKNILFLKKEIYFFVQNCDILSYDEHFCCYKIKLQNEDSQSSYDVIKKEAIYSYKPFPACSIEKKDAIYVKPYSFVNLL